MRKRKRKEGSSHVRPPPAGSPCASGGKRAEPRRPARKLPGPRFVAVAVATNNRTWRFSRLLDFDHH
eukprot:5227812-Pyramimonas_sp.AAC.1